MSYGPTSGIFTFILSVSENGKAEYYNIYHSFTFYRFVFEVQDGTLRLKGLTQDEPPKAEYFDFVIDGDNIAISSDSQDIGYWGEQGINSTYASHSSWEDDVNQDAKPNNQSYFNGEVLSVYDKHFLVKCLDVTHGGISVSAEVQVSKSVVSANGVPQIKVGDTLRVVYTGVQETYPLKLQTVFAVYLVDNNGNIIT